MTDAQLSDLQLDLLRILWDRKEATALDVHATVVQQSRELAPTTVSTMLSRLEKKGLILITQLPGAGRKQLVLINAHLTAFDSVGNMRPLELAYLRERILAEQSAGSYVIVGGDWNSAMPGGKTPACDKSQDDRSWLIDMPADFIAAGWTWAAGLNAPTVRTLGAPRNSRSTCYAYIDGMLLSPGVELRRASTVDLNFQNSDHNPVEVEVTLR